MKTWGSIVLGLALMLVLCSLAQADGTVGGKPAPSQVEEDTQTSVTALTADVAVLDTKADDSATSQVNILAEIVIVERHLHPPSGERWLGDGASSMTMTAYTTIAGTDDWGDWLPILTGSDTPIVPAMTFFDLHHVVVSSVDTAAITRLQIGWDATAAGNIVSGNQFSEILFFPTGIGANVAAAPTDIRMPRLPAGMLVWARVWVNGEDGAGVDLFVGIHEYAE